MVHLNIAQKLSKNYNVVSFLLRGGPLFNELQKCSVATACIAGRRFRGTIYLSLITDALKPAFIIVNSIVSDTVFPAIALLNAPVISLVHEFMCYAHPLYGRQRMIEGSNAVVFSCEATKNDAQQWFPSVDIESKSTIAPQGRCRSSEHEIPNVEEKLFGEKNEVSIRPKLVVGMGSVSLRKGCDLFILCAKQFFDKYPGEKVRFVWIGHGYEPLKDMSYSVYLKEQISRSGLQDKVAFVNEFASVEPVYRLADVLLLTSRLDPLPNVAIDAICEGLPIIAFSGTGGIPELLINAGMGRDLVAGHLDTQQMTDKLQAILSNDGLRTKLAAQLVQFGNLAFDLSSYVDKLVGLANLCPKL
jgi:glycosyltransferase involved in cell wall biosynthesis